MDTRSRGWDLIDMTQKWTMLCWVFDRSLWFTSVIRASGRIPESTYEATTIVIGNDVSLDNLTEWFLMSRARSTRHGSKVDRHHVGYLLEISDTWAQIGQNGYKKALAKSQRYGSMIDVNQWVHLLGVDDMQHYLRKSSRALKQRGRLSIISLREALSLGTGCDLL
jgi:hypothetical protein